MNFKLIEALKQIEMEKGLDVDMVLDALSDALVTAYKKNYDVDAEARIDIDKDSGEIRVFEIVEDESGEMEEFEVTPENFGRIAAQTAKQVIIQRIREAERELMFDEYHGREGDIVTGIVQQNDQRYTLIDLGKVEALLPPGEQVRGERYDHGARLKTYIVDVRKTTKGPQIMVSRTHPGLLKRLFELEVPEIYDGLVEIKAVAREAGQRSKVAVVSNDPNVDPVGACVGAKGSRVRMIVSELRGEKVDIVEWKEDPAEFVANAISPAKVKEVIVDPENLTAEVIVPDNQLSLAIGKEGQNARLAAKLTGWRIDILSESQAVEAAAIRAEREEEEKRERENQCRAITASGRRCRNKALPGSDFCGLAAHQRLEELIKAGSSEVMEVAPLEDDETGTVAEGLGTEELEAGSEESDAGNVAKQTGGEGQETEEPVIPPGEEIVAEELGAKSTRPEGTPAEGVTSPAEEDSVGSADTHAEETQELLEGSHEVKDTEAALDEGENADNVAPESGDSR